VIGTYSGGRVCC